MVRTLHKDWDFGRVSVLPGFLKASSSLEHNGEEDMSKAQEISSYEQQGKDHVERGIDCPPSDRLNEVIFRGLSNETSINEADEAYERGRKSS